jgi:hypothetical protein
VTIIEKLKARIHACGDGEPIPGWCVATGKCTCVRLKALMKRLEGEDERVQGLAEAAYDAGADQ